MLTEYSLAFVDIDYTPLTTPYDRNQPLGMFRPSLCVCVVMSMADVAGYSAQRKSLVWLCALGSIADTCVVA